MERRGEFAAASLQTESYLEREHNARWAALGVAHATSGITANVLTLLLPPPPPPTAPPPASSIPTRNPPCPHWTKQDEPRRSTKPVTPLTVNNVPHPPP